METITLSGGGALQFTNITECDTWRVTETECDVTMRNMTPTIILFMSLIIASQALFFGGVRNARQNDMWVVVNIVTFLLLMIFISRPTTMMATPQSRSTSGWGWSEWTASGPCPQVRCHWCHLMIMVSDHQVCPRGCQTRARYCSGLCGAGKVWIASEIIFKWPLIYL